MKFKLFILVVTLLSATLFLLSSFLLFSEHICDSSDSLNVSFQVKHIPGRQLLGFNADSDKLNFGIVSPGITARRSTIVRYAFPALTTVTMEGELSSWTIITPSNFSLQPAGQQEVFFDITVPAYALGGNYSGKAVFCFQKIK